MIKQYLDYDKVNKWIFKRMFELKKDYGALTHCVDLEDGQLIITDGYLAFKVAKTSLMFDVGCFHDAIPAAESLMRLSFTLLDKAQRIHYTDRCVSRYNKPLLRYWTAKDNSFVVLMDEKKQQEANNANRLAMFGSGKLEPIQFADCEYKKVYAIVMPVGYDDKDIGPLLGTVTET